MEYDCRINCIRWRLIFIAKLTSEECFMTVVSANCLLEAGNDFIFLKKTGKNINSVHAKQRKSLFTKTIFCRDGFRLNGTCLPIEINGV